jgi:F420-0:gamma-glutamyl ligase
VVGQGKIKGMYKKIAMADLIEELTDLPMKTQEAVLKNLSEEMIPLEIDGDIFMIHKNVSSLIDNLVLQISDLKIQEKINARKKND